MKSFVIPNFHKKFPIIGDSIFPPINNADPESGLVAIGGDFSLSTLIDAYSHGIFPWPMDERFEYAWFSPDHRGILNFSDLHIPRSVKKFIKKIERNNLIEIQFNKHFQEVITCCQKYHQQKNSNTWITDSLVEGYVELFRFNHAYSLEAIERSSGKLIAGLYGVHFNGVVSAESMFTLQDNVSKYLIIKLMESLAQVNIFWIDVQMVSPIVETLGGTYISRDQFLQKIL